MAEYSVTIDLIVDADDCEDAYNKVCRMISANTLSREVCDIRLDNEEQEKGKGEQL